MFSKSEKSYVLAGLTSSPPHRSDGRSLHEYRPISLETGVAPLANGSAKVNIGRNPHDGSGGTEVMAACKLEVESAGEQGSEGVDGGRVLCHVNCSPAAYPSLSQLLLDDLSADYTSLLSSTLSHQTLRPKNLTIIPKRKSWCLHIDLLILSDAGNIYDVMFIAAKAALWDTKVPRTRSVEYKSRRSAENEDVEMVGESGLDTRHLRPSATDFELPDYWDEGEDLEGRDRWPVCVSLNVAKPIHYLDPTLCEESSTPYRLLVAFSFLDKDNPKLQLMHLLGQGELTLEEIKDLVMKGQQHASTLYQSLSAKLEDEDARRGKRDREKFDSARSRKDQSNH